MRKRIQIGLKVRERKLARHVSQNLVQWTNNILLFIYLFILNGFIVRSKSFQQTLVHPYANTETKEKKTTSLQFISICELKCPGNPKYLELSRRFSWFLVASTIKMTAKALNPSPVAENVDLMRSVKRRRKRSQCGFATPAKIVFHSYLYQRNSSVFAERLNRSIQSL